MIQSLPASEPSKGGTLNANHVLLDLAHTISVFPTISINTPPPRPPICQFCRNLRRRSASTPGPGALPVDPDLPPPSPTYPESSTSYSSNDDITLSTPDGLDPTSSGLFWVPAHLHPELAPGEFRAFLKSHTQVDPENPTSTDNDESSASGFLARRNSSRKGKGDGLGRKRSMLSKQYQPRMGDGVEEEVPPLPLGRGRGSLYGRGSSGDKGLTLEDLQRLEMLVEGEGEGGDEDPERLRSVLRRSLSTNVAPGCEFCNNGKVLIYSS